MTEESIRCNTVHNVLDPSGDGCGLQYVNHVDFLSSLFSHQITMKLFHLNTKIYSHHKSSDSYLEKYRQRLDHFLEIYQGKYGNLNSRRIEIVIDPIGSTFDIFSHIHMFGKVLIEKIDNLSCDEDLKVDLLDMINDIHQFNYLLKLK